jgi:serine/threonine protein kinase
MGARSDQLLNGKYRILHEVGQGGMAVVHKGVDTTLDREVAIKVLHPHLASRADSRIRLQREARAVARLNHPNIVEIYDYSGLDSDESFIVTEYIRGETLKEFIDRHDPALPEIGAMIVHEIAGAVAHAHDAGIIHRDIKPENIMIRDDGRLKLMDFGIAQIAELQAMTITGALVGSPAHMSPEHVEGKTLDWRADVFSLGTLLYTLAARRLPFESASPHALLRQILEARYDDPRIHNPAISRRLYQIIAQCLKREPDERYESARALQDALGGYLRDIGFTDPAAELREFFEHPPKSEPDLTRRVVEKLLEGARRSASAGRVPAALEAYNQVLALDPRADAVAEVNRLSTSHTRRTIARRVVASLAAVAAVVGLVVALKGAVPNPEPQGPEPQGPDASTALATTTPGPAASIPAAPTVLPPRAPPDVPRPLPVDVGVERRDFEAMAGRMDRTPPSLMPAPAAVSTPPPPEVVRAALDPRLRPNGRPREDGKPREPAVMRPGGSKPEPEPKGVRVRLVALYGAGLVFQGQGYDAGATPFLTLQPGTYSVKVHHPACDECVDRTHTFRVSPETPDTLKFPIGFVGAQLVVHGTAGARVRSGETIGTTGAPLSFEMTSPERRVDVTVTKSGYQDKSFRARLTPGKRTEVTADLLPIAP